MEARRQVGGAWSGCWYPVDPLDILAPQEMVLLEIEVMNQLNHRNLIQLYSAIETSHEIILFME